MNSVVDAIKRKNDARRANNIGVGAVKRTEKRAVRKIEKKKAEEKVAKDAAFMGKFSYPWTYLYELLPAVYRPALSMHAFLYVPYRVLSSYPLSTTRADISIHNGPYVCNTERKLADKRERKREAALKLAKELHQRKVELNFIFAGKERAAAKQGEDLARGNIRQEKQHFRRQKLGKEVERRVAKIDHRQKLKLVKQEKRAYRKKMKEYNKKCKEKEIESQHYIDEDSKRKKEQATLVKTRREAALRAEAIRAPFVAKVKNFQAEKAKGLERRRKAIEARNLARSAGVVEVEDLSMMPTLPMEALEKTLIREELDDFTYTQHPMYNDPVEVEAVL